MKANKKNADTGLLYVLITISAIILIGCLYCAFSEFQLDFAGANILK
jgi:hypothetical protein